MAYIGCDFGLPKTTAKAHAIESKDSIGGILEEVPSRQMKNLLLKVISKNSRFLSKKWRIRKRSNSLGLVHMNNSQSLNGLAKKTNYWLASSVTILTK